jgi:hypothetical protein
MPRTERGISRRQLAEALVEVPVEVVFSTRPFLRIGAEQRAHPRADTG